MNDDLTRVKQSQAAKRKSLAEWRASRQMKIEDMPSGMPGVIVRDVALLDLALSGKLPNTLLDLVLNTEGNMKLEEIIPENTSEFGDLLDALLTAALVEPKIGETADDEHITLDEIPGEDKIHIFYLLNREAEVLRPFRGEEGEPAQAASRSQGVRDKAKQPAAPADRIGGLAAE